MTTGQTYTLKTTGEKKVLDHIESIPNNPAPIMVYVFSDGERWASDLIFKYWTLDAEPRAPDSSHDSESTK